MKLKAPMFWIAVAAGLAALAVAGLKPVDRPDDRPMSSALDVDPWFV